MSDQSFNYILVGGYTATGSSAAIDLLKECTGVYAPDWEFRLIVDPHGVIDLDRALNNPIDTLNQDVAIREFLDFINKYSRCGGGFRPYGMNYNTVFGKRLLSLAQEYIDQLTDYSYVGYWWYLEFFKPYTTYIAHKILKRVKLYDARKHSTMRLYCKSDEEFIRITTEYINSIFAALVAERGIDCHTLVLDQAVPANRPAYANRCFAAPKVISVDRDPRDVFIGIITEEQRNGDLVGHVGFDVASSHNIPLFIDWYKESHRTTKDDIASQNVLKLQFEDIILNYEQTARQILDFAGIPQESHTAKGKYLQPEKSAKNIGLWRSYDHPEEIRMIERELSEYLYHGHD